MNSKKLKRLKTGLEPGAIKIITNFEIFFNDEELVQIREHLESQQRGQAESSQKDNKAESGRQEVGREPEQIPQAKRPGVDTQDLIKSLTPAQQTQVNKKHQA